jgi:peptidyl-prolyl cis-trans isomerase D
MFDLIRNHQRVLLFLLVLLIFPAFAFFGISGYDRMFAGDANSVAKVGELSISSYEFENARQQQMQNMRRMLGDQFDPDMLDTPASRNEILEQLISQRVLAVAAQDKFVVVPDGAVRNAISEIPAFQNEDGQFDIDRYKQMLAAQGQSELGFESRVRADLAIQSVPRSVSQSGFIPRTVSRKLVELNRQKRKFRSRTFQSTDYIEKVEVDDAKVRTFYDENPKLFESAESLKIEYLVLSEKEIADKIEVTDDEVNEYYEQNASAYVQEEQRKARHILVNMSPDASDEEKQAAKDKAAGLLTRVRDGEDFAELAKAESDDPGSAEQGGDLGFFDRQTMAEAFSNAAFSLALNDISDVVETEFGLHIIQVTEVREREQESLEKARPKILQELKAAKARDAFGEASEVMTNTAYEQPDSLAPTAEKLEMDLLVLDQYQRFGTPDLPPDSPLANPRVVRALFADQAIQSKKNIDVVEASPDQLVVARVLAHQPSKLQDFSAVEADAQSRVRAREAAALAKADGEALLAKLKSGTKPEGFDEARSVDRYGSGLPRPASDALFSATADKFPGFIGVELGQRGYMVQELIAIEDASKEDVDKALESFASQTAAAAGQEASRGFLEALKDTIPIERFPERLSSANDPDEG